MADFGRLIGGADFRPSQIIGTLTKLRYHPNFDIEKTNST